MVKPSAWDFKVSPNHDWIVSRFEKNREGSQQENDVKTVSYSMLSTPKALHTLLKIDLDKLHLSDQILDVGVSAITRRENNRLAHWALTHPSKKPDFHHPDSFALQV